jgi:hypothetical protein
VSLGINKDLESMARRWRRAGGTVKITRRNHVVWAMPPRGTAVRSRLTMHNTTAHQVRRRLERCLSDLNMSQGS